jgi:hypothetical protein
MVELDDKHRSKMLRKLEGFVKYPHVETSENGTRKSATIDESFQVNGKLFAIELVVINKLTIVDVDMVLSVDQHMVTYNSRAKDGGHILYSKEDIAQFLGINQEDLEPIFKTLDDKSKFTKRELEKAQKFFTRKLTKSMNKLAKQG